MPDRNRIFVELTLRSGGKQVFEITEDILDDLEYFQSEGLSSRELCRTWLELIPRDPPTLVRVSGKRANGTDVLIELPCEEHSIGRPERNRTRQG